ncbi:MAG: type II secretion system protein [Methylococcales bacterium]
MEIISTTKKAGFTLVEMMVSLAILSLLITVLLSGFYRGLAVWEQGEKKEQIWQTLLTRQQWLRNLFAQALLANYSQSQENVYVPYFEGSSVQMQFISAAPLLENPGQVKPVQLKFELEEDTKNYTLFYQEGDVHSDPDRDLKWTGAWVPLLRHLKAGTFSYEAFAFPVPQDIDISLLGRYAKQRYRDHTEWLSSYDTGQLWIFPRRVKIKFIDVQDHSHEWQFIFNTSADVGNLGFSENDWF